MSRHAAPPPGSALFGLKRYRKLVRPRLTALVLEDGYHVQREAARALDALGHRGVQFDLRAAGPDEDARARLARLLHAIAQTRPDFLLSINYVGFDRAGWLGEVVESIELPVAVWFVDAPLFFGMGYMPPTPEMTSFFVWDKTHLTQLRHFGAERLHALPLGCEPEAFAEAAGAKAPGQLPLAFVGSSMVPLTATWRGRLQPDEIAEGERMAEQLYCDPRALHRLVPDPHPPIDRRALMAAYANCLASRRYRRGLLAALPQPSLHVFGDAGWQHELPRAQLHGPVSYGGALAGVYRGADINCNATIRQMPTAVNQRVFDVPAAGGFVLTDDQEELHELFDVDAGEAVTYSGPQQLAAQVERYHKDAAARAAVVARGRARVLAEHTYVHRLRTLVHALRHDHGPAARAARAQFGAAPH